MKPDDRNHRAFLLIRFFIKVLKQSLIFQI